MPPANRMSQERRIWSRRWHDPSLQELGLWLSRKRVADDEAADAIDNIWAFYSYYILPTLARRVPLGIAARDGQTRPAVTLLLPELGSIGVSAKKQGKNRAQILDDAEVELVPNSPESVAVTVDFTDVPVGEQLREAFRGLSVQWGKDFLGIFVDDLAGEFATVVGSASHDVAWLDTPNLALGGERPRDLLESDDPLRDRPLRDLLLSLKHGIAA